MLCNLCMKDVDWVIEVKQHRREHPMTYIVTREICLNCLMDIQEKVIPQLEIYSLICPKGHEPKPGAIIHCNNIRKGPFYCPECNSKMKKIYIEEIIEKAKNEGNSSEEIEKRNT